MTMHNSIVLANSQEFITSQPTNSGSSLLQVIDGLLWEVKVEWESNNLGQKVRKEARKLKNFYNPNFYNKQSVCC